MLNKMTFLNDFLNKIFDNVYKHHAVICISILMLRIGLRLVDLRISLRLVDLHNYLDLCISLRSADLNNYLDVVY